MRSTQLKIPSFSLYGEAPAAPSHSNGVHIEDIQSRSRKYLWKIGAHRHTLLSQCIWVSEGPAAAVLDERRADLSGPSVIIVPAGTVHGFKFGADTQGHVLTVDLARVLGTAGSAHQAAIEALFSSPRAVDLRGDPQLAARVRLQFLEAVRVGDDLRVTAHPLPRLDATDAASVTAVEGRD